MKTEQLRCPKCESSRVFIEVQDGARGYGCKNCNEWSYPSAMWLELNKSGFRSEERRNSWTCYEVLHSGDGPCRRPERVAGVHRVAFRDAAEIYAMETVNRRPYDYRDGDELFVAVEVAEGEAVYCVVRLSLQAAFACCDS